jgi:coproporphyrinogen III oxidase
MRAKFEKMIRAAQNEICSAVEELDGQKFQEDAWTRPGGGGGISRVLQGGNVFEKAGVNVSVVYGQMPPEAYRAATGEQGSGKEMIPFFAAGISSVMHPHNPMAPTVHFNYRYFETDAPEGAEAAPRAWWFGGVARATIALPAPSSLVAVDPRPPRPRPRPRRRD